MFTDGSNYVILISTDFVWILRIKLILQLIFSIRERYDYADLYCIKKNRGKAMTKKNEFLQYKNRPLVRCGNTIYYGSMGDEYVVMLQIHDSKNVKDMNLSGKISVKLIMTDETKNPLERIVKSSEKEGLYKAMDIANIWLDDALKKKS